MKIYTVFLAFFIFLTNTKSFSQENNQRFIPKIGLCLSGGGAKGLAHIGLLKLIDSLGIKIDCITGTSMGGVIGGLYASGYSGKQIDSLARTADWDVLLNQFLPMNEIYMDEKDEYNKYIMEIPFRKGRPKITGIIDGQPLINLLTRLTHHVSHIHNFNNLPIPFKCMAVDIINVEPVILDSGNLVMAMRSTMSIPTIFKPVKLDDKLLVDGGLMINFPVKEVKKMGADIVIGSYTGGRLMSEGEMNNFVKLLIQSSGFYGIREAKDQIDRCDIFNNLTGKMKNFKAGDFKKHKQIMEAGDNIARAVLPNLIELSKTLAELGVLQPKKDYVASVGKIKINTVVIDSIQKMHLLRFVQKRIIFTTAKDSVAFSDIDKSLKKIYGTRFFIRPTTTLIKTKTIYIIYRLN